MEQQSGITYRRLFEKDSASKNYAALPENLREMVVAVVRWDVGHTQDALVFSKNAIQRGLFNLEDFRMQMGLS